MEEVKNAKIVSTFLGIEDHGIFTFSLNMEYEGSWQGFGSYALDDKNSKSFITGILKAVGVSKWEDLPHKYVRIVRDDGLIVKIGHIVDEIWFEPKAFYNASPR